MSIRWSTHVTARGDSMLTLHHSGGVSVLRLENDLHRDGDSTVEQQFLVTGPEPSDDDLELLDADRFTAEASQHGPTPGARYREASRESALEHRAVMRMEEGA